MLKKVLIGLAALVAIFLAVVATRPDTYHVERSVVMKAPSPQVFAELNDFHNWPAWSPWEKMDPQLQRSYSGSETGVGAVYSWVGNEKVGKGAMTIVEAVPSQKVAIKLEFLEPWQSTANVLFSIKEEDQGSKLTWSMDGENNFVSKAFSMFMDMDTMIGGDFERGLASLKEISEAKAQKAAEVAAAAAAQVQAEQQAAAEKEKAAAPVKKKK